MEHVKEVKATNGHSHWTVAGPGGSAVEFNAITTKSVKNQVLAWKSQPNETIKSAGIVQFRPVNDGSTRVTVRMSYTPPAGAVGHTVASLFGVDPKQAVDEDLVRMKSLIEEGKTTAGGQRVSKAEASSEA